MKANLGLPQHQFPAYWNNIQNLSNAYTYAMWNTLLDETIFKDTMPSQDYDFYCMYMATDLI
jgi:hypothetical protein